MAFSLSSWFKGKPDAAESEDGSSETPKGKQTSRFPNVPPSAVGVPPPSVRTVMPSSNAQTPVSLRTPGAPSAPAARPPVTRNLPVRPPARKVSFPVPSVAAVAAPPAPPKPVFVAPPPPVPEAPDTAVSLAVGDFIDRLPPNFLSTGEFDRTRVVEFRASELYSDLAKGRASVPASTIYAKCPEIFARPVTDTEDMEIQLPLQKLVEQLSAAFRTRADQVAEENVGEIETPFLQVALEDSARLPKVAGTSAGAIRPVSLPVASIPEVTTGLPSRPAHRTGQISTISAKPVVEPPPGPTFAPPINPGKRPPSTVRASVAGGKIRLSGPTAVTRMVAAPTVPPPLAKAPGSPSTTQRIEVPKSPNMAAAASPSHLVTKKTARIQIPPISLKPPGSASSAIRPPAGTPPPPVPVQSSPVTIHPPDGGKPPLTFRSSPPPPPSVKLPPPSFAPSRPSFPPPSFPAVPPPNAGAGTLFPAISVPPPAPAAPPDLRKIELGLAAVLRGQPASALAVEPEDVADDVRFTLPFALIEKQLSSGRVSVPRQTFVDALPESHRHVLAEDGGATEIQIPLQEVFQNLPGNALTIRQDQVIEEVGHAYPTPFAQKADEDAQRLGAVAPVAPPQAAAPEVPSAPVQTPAEPSEEVMPVEASEETFASLFEEEAPASTVPDEIPTGDEAAQPEELAHDVPLDQAETPVETPVPEEPEAAVEEPAATETKSAEEPPTIAPVTGVHPSEAAVEPPIASEPAHVEEALAVLESTAPAGEEEKETASGDDLESKTRTLSAPEETTSAPGRTFLPGKSAPPVGLTKPSVAAASPMTTAPAQDTELQTALMTEEELDAKGVVRHVCQLPGINGCAVMFADGLRLAGNFPDGDTEGFNAMAPSFFKRTSNFLTETDLGSLQAITLYTDRGLLSFFMHAEICLSVRHTGRGFLPGVREKLEIVTRELARMYATEKSVIPHGDSTL